MAALIEQTNLHLSTECVAKLRVGPRSSDPPLREQSRPSHRGSSRVASLRSGQPDRKKPIARPTGTEQPGKTRADSRVAIRTINDSASRGRVASRDVFLGGVGRLATESGHEENRYFLRSSKRPARVANFLPFNLAALHRFTAAFLRRIGGTRDARRNSRNRSERRRVPLSKGSR